MRGERPWRTFVLGVLALGGVLALLMAQGCAKRPTQPAVSGAAPTAAGSVGNPSAGKPDETRPTGAAPVPSAARSGAVRPGAPGKPPLPSEFTATSQIRDIHFDFDRYDIKAGEAKILEANAQWLKASPNLLVLVEGHCDERGTNEYNLALGERRARAVTNFLVGQGIQASRITTVTYGEERPLCTEKNEACRSQNRRAHFLVKPS